jgi:hypothetical protein
MLEIAPRSGGGGFVTNPDQPLELKNGVVRFKPNWVVRYLLDAGGVDLNLLGSIRYLFTQTDWDQFMQLIGYSVSGYGDLSDVSRESVVRADAAADELLKTTTAAQSGEDS